MLLSRFTPPPPVPHGRPRRAKQQIHDGTVSLTWISCHQTNAPIYSLSLTVGSFSLLPPFLHLFCRARFPLLLSCIFALLQARGGAGVVVVGVCSLSQQKGPASHGANTLPQSQPHGRKPWAACWCVQGGGGVRLQRSPPVSFLRTRVAPSGDGRCRAPPPSPQPPLLFSRVKQRRRNKEGKERCDGRIEAQKRRYPSEYIYVSVPTDSHF